TCSRRCGRWSCATTWAVRTTARCSSTRPRHCRRRPPATGASRPSSTASPRTVRCRWGRGPTVSPPRWTTTSGCPPPWPCSTARYGPATPRSRAATARRRGRPRRRSARWRPCWGSTRWPSTGGRPGRRRTPRRRRSTHSCTPSWRRAAPRAGARTSPPPTPSGTDWSRRASRWPTPRMARSGHSPTGGTDMAGNSNRRGAIRKSGTKKGQVVGSGGQRRRGLEARGATPRAEDRTYHPARRQAKAAKRQEQGAQQRRRRAQKQADGPEVVVGRNPVVECLRAGAPATALYVAVGAEADERLTEAVRVASDRGISILEVPRNDLDRMTSNGLHQGIGLQVPPYSYTDPADLLRAAMDAPEPALLVALDNITDPRNLGAVIRSTSAFGGHGVLIPERRSASITAVAWRSSAGAAARLPVARATNLNRTLPGWARSGAQLVGLDAGGDVSLDDYDGSGPTIVVVGSEGKGRSRLVRENCDSILSIPIASEVESLNASVAA